MRKLKPYNSHRSKSGSFKSSRGRVARKAYHGWKNDRLAQTGKPSSKKAYDRMKKGKAYRRKRYYK